jgi:DNA repair exonuclease SbcCD nuclease subunit
MEIKRIELETTFEQLLFLGDVHGDWDVTRYFLKEKKLSNVCIFQVGDFGIGFKHFLKEKRPLESLQGFLKKRNCTLLVIRGNHDNPAMFETDYFKLPNIKFISDYSIVTINIKNTKKNIFCVGGAISIDRGIRKQNMDWWMDEQVNFITDLHELNTVKDIHIMITHTSPNYVDPFYMGSIVTDFAKHDPNLKSELMQERLQMGNMTDYIINENKETLKHYFYGHFHKHFLSWYKDVRFECLNINQFVEYDF